MGLDMHKDFRLWSKLNKLVVIVIAIAICSSTPVYATSSVVSKEETENTTTEQTGEGSSIEETIPVETVDENKVTMKIADALGQGAVNIDVASYLDYKNISERDYEAYEWSFALSQLAKPFIESISDVLNNTVSKQMLTNDLAINNEPEIINKDYVYVPIPSSGEAYKITAVKYKEIYDTITKNLRYNKLVDASGTQYSLGTLLKGGVTGKTGYVSDLVFTNKDTPEVPTAELKNNIASLYEIDDLTKASNLLTFVKDEKRLIGADTSAVLRTQRRLVPILLGTDITEAYIQMGIMIYCKSEDNTNFENLLTLHGNDSVYVDSFGSIVFYDTAAQKYKNILPNACNTLLTSKNEKAESKSLYSEEFKSALNGSSDIKKHLSYSDKFDLGVTVPWYNEKTFMYNKLLGSIYSSKVKGAQTGEQDTTEYNFSVEEDRLASYYPNYIGPTAANRSDYRNSFVFMKPNETYFGFSLWDAGAVITQGTSNLWDWFLASMGDLFAPDSLARNVSIYNGETFNSRQQIYANENSGNYEEGVLPPTSILLNSGVYNVKTANDNKFDDKIKSEASKAFKQGEMFVTSSLINNYCSIGLLQTAQDTLMNKSRGQYLEYVKDGEKGTPSKAAITVSIPDSSLIDVAEPTLLGPDGGFITESKTIRSEEDVYDITYQLKRDNRLSNKFTEMPKDDFIVLFYTWLQEYNKSLQTYSMSQEYKELTKTAFDVPADSSYNNIATAMNVGAKETYTYTVNGYCSANVDYASLKQIANAVKKTTTATTETTTEFKNPLSLEAVVNPYVTMMALYRNTDIDNNPNAVVFEEKVKEVDIVNLAQKIEFGIDNPITKISNMISGFTQVIHNAVAVNGTNNFMVDFINSKAFADALSWYIVITWAFLFVLLFIKVVGLIVSRKGILRQLTSFLVVVGMFVSVPYLFKFTQLGGQALMTSTTQSMIDKTTLISTEKQVRIRLNNDLKAEQRFDAYRQQFASVEDVYAEAKLKALDGISNKKLNTKMVSLDDYVKNIFVNSNTVIHDTENKWYDSTKFMPVHADSYKNDINLFFYDYLFYKYIEYYADELNGSGDILSMAQSLPLGQVVGEDGTPNITSLTTIAENTEKAFISAKGGMYGMFNNPIYVQDNDVIGVAALLNQKTTDETSSSYLKSYFNAVDIAFEKKESAFKTYDVSPLSTEYLEQEVGRSTFYSSHKQAVTGEKGDTKIELTTTDDLVFKVSDNALKRIKGLLEYRKGEFSDISLMYVSSIIIAEEFVKETTGEKIGIQDTTDIDKIMRVVYSKNTENIYNQEELMYIIQDTIAGGSILTIFVVLYELLFRIITVVNVLMCVFISIMLPILFWRFQKHKGMTLNQLIGYVSQTVLSFLSVFVATIPLIVMSNLANKIMSDFSYWCTTILMLVVAGIAVTLTYYCIKVLIKDFASLGGAMIKAAAMTAMTAASDFISQDSTIETDSPSMDISNSDVTMNTDAAQLQADELLATEYEGQTVNTPQNDSFENNESLGNANMVEAGEQETIVFESGDASLSEQQTVRDTVSSDTAVKNTTPNTNPVEATDKAYDTPTREEINETDVLHENKE